MRRVDLAGYKYFMKYVVRNNIKTNFTQNIVGLFQNEINIKITDYGYV